jgi:hypothetical protein
VRHFVTSASGNGADMIVPRQARAARQTWNPEAEAAAAWNDAGTLLVPHTRWTRFIQHITT